MAAPFIVNWIQVRFRMRGAGGDIINTFNFRKTSAGVPTGTQLASFAQAFYNAVITDWRPLVAATVQFVDVTARDMASAGGQEGTYVAPSNTFGTSSGEALPNNVALAITERSSFVGPSGRGRWFMGGFTEAATNGDVLTAAFATSIATLAGHVLGFIGDGVTTAVLAVASRSHLTMRDVTSIVITSIMDSMRRRLTGRGR